jgi:hypothetical protein
MKYLLIAISVLFSLSVTAQRSIRTGKLYLDESIQLNKVYSSDTLLFFIQNNAIGTGLSLSITNPSLSFDFSATDLGFFLNYTNGDTSTFDVRADGVLLQWGVNDGNVGIGTETPTEKLHVDGTVLITETLTYDIPSAATGYVLTSQDAIGNSKWQDPTGYGEMGFGDSTRTIALTQNVFSVVTNSNNTLWSTAAIDLHNVTYSGDSLIIDSAGTYQVNVQLSVEGTNASIIRMGVFINGVLACTCTGWQQLSNNLIVQLTYINIDTFNVGDVVQVVVTNTANSDDVDAIAGKITINKIR